MKYPLTKTLVEEFISGNVRAEISIFVSRFRAIFTKHFTNLPLHLLII